MLPTRPPPGLAIDFPESKLYWISSGNHTINRCNLDGSGLEVIDAMRNQLGKATALAIMGEGRWVGAGTGAGQARLGWLGRRELAQGQPAQPARPVGKTRWWVGRGPSAASHSPAAAPGDKLWWADQVSEKMGTCNKADGSGAVVLRNSTTLVMHMKVYDESIQLGEPRARGRGWGWESEVKAAASSGCRNPWAS